MYGAGFACSGFLFILDRRGVLAEALAGGDRRLAGDVLRRRALPQIGPVIRRGENAPAARRGPDRPRA